MADIARLTQLIEPEAKALGFDLVRVRMFGGGSDRTLQVMAERPDTRQLTIDDCADLSRRISGRLDALEEAGKDPIDVAYRLEVSSPGIDRPLTRRADFADWAGHEAKVALKEKLNGRQRFNGELVGIDSAGPHAAPLFRSDQPRCFEHREMLEKGGEPHGERFGELRHRRRALQQAADHRAPRRVGECVKDGVESGLLVRHMVNHR